MALIKCNSLSLGYEGRTIIENLSFEVNAGDYLCVVGENGSGKTTLMKALLGLKSPIAGEIVFGDGLTKTEIGYLPQQTAVQRDFPASVREVVLSGCLNKCGLSPFFSPKLRARAEDNTKRLGIDGIANRCYRELSGGQQQRVLLARALCASSRLILLDEPVAGLDPKVTADMYTVIEELNRSGVSVIMISHDIAAATRYASHILHISHEPLFFGKTEDYLKSDVAKFFTETKGE